MAQGIYVLIPILLFPVVWSFMAHLYHKKLSWLSALHGAIFHLRTNSNKKMILTEKLSESVERVWSGCLFEPRIRNIGFFKSTFFHLGDVIS